MNDFNLNFYITFKSNESMGVSRTRDDVNFGKGRLIFIPQIGQSLILDISKIVEGDKQYFVDTLGKSLLETTGGMIKVRVIDISPRDAIELSDHEAQLTDLRTFNVFCEFVP